MRRCGSSLIQLSPRLGLDALGFRFADVASVFAAGCAADRQSSVCGIIDWEAAPRSGKGTLRHLLAVCCIEFAHRSSRMMSATSSCGSRSSSSNKEDDSTQIADLVLGRNVKSFTIGWLRGTTDATSESHTQAPPIKTILSSLSRAI